ncbi:hypothetical protein FRB94_013271 [Tulasnella sp. JGI-2019a]|nr:hypothetical protein FRB94_013271 [Tulasnella sp. JGI-2019a]
MEALPKAKDLFNVLFKPTRVDAMIAHLRPEYPSSKVAHFTAPHLVGSPYTIHMTASHPMKKNPAVELMVDSFTKNEIKQGAVAAFEKMRAEQLKDPAQLKQKAKKAGQPLFKKNDVLKVAGAAVGGTIIGAGITGGAIAATTPKFQTKLRQASRMVKVRKIYIPDLLAR